MGKKFNFDLYRLNVVDVQDLFVAADALRLRTDDEIINVIETSSSPDFDLDQETRTAIYGGVFGTSVSIRRSAECGVLFR